MTIPLWTLWVVGPLSLMAGWLMGWAESWLASGAAPTRLHCPDCERECNTERGLVLHWYGEHAERPQLRVVKGGRQ